MPGGDVEQGHKAPQKPFNKPYGSTNLSTLSLPYQYISRHSSKSTLTASSSNFSPVSSKNYLPYRRSSDFSVGSRGSRHRRAPPIHYLPALIAVILFGFTIAAWSLSGVSCGIALLCRESFNDVLARNTGTYAPFAEHPWPKLPATCQVDQVSIVSPPSPNALLGGGHGQH